MPKVTVRFDGTPRRAADAVHEYVAAAKDQYAKSTVDNKVLTLKRMLKVVQADTWVHEITPQEMNQVWNLICTTRSENSRIIDHQGLKKFFEWCDDMGYRTGVNPMKHIRCPKAFFKQRKRVPVEQFPELLAAASITPRDRMFVANGLYMLCRKTELYQIPWGDVDREAGIIYVTRFKTKEDDVLAISDELESELKYYEDWYRYVTETPKHQQLNPAWYLTPRFTRPIFLGNQKWMRGMIRPDTHMGLQDGAKATLRALNAIGFPTRDLMTGKALGEGAHTLRRSGARALYDALVESGRVDALLMVQRQLGHASPTQTQKYIGADEDRLTRNSLIKGKVMYPKAAAAKEILVADQEQVKQYGHLRVVS